jgi:hypothetical protein
MFHHNGTYSLSPLRKDLQSPAGSQLQSSIKLDIVPNVVEGPVCGSKQQMALVILSPKPNLADFRCYWLVSSAICV